MEKYVTQSKQQRESRLKNTLNEQRLRNLWDYNKISEGQITGLPEEEGKEGGAEKIVIEIMAENFPNLVKDLLKNFHEKQTG